MFRALLFGCVAGLGAVTGALVSPQPELLPSPAEVIVTRDQGRGIAARLQSATVMIESGPFVGSGVVVRGTDGHSYVFTVAHVTRGEAKVRLTFQDGTERVGAVLAENRDIDAAILLARDVPPSVEPARLYDGPPPGLGEDVLAVGSSTGRDGQGTVTSGIVSYVGRRYCGQGEMDQCSAPTFPGNSGGPIALRESGLVIGLLRGGTGESFSLYVPVRAIRAWVRALGVTDSLGD